jgi:hypothetical protein
MMFTLIYEKHQSLLSILIYTEDCKHLALPDAPAPSYCTDSVYGLSVRTQCTGSVYGLSTFASPNAIVKASL